jgi:putative redox protein
MTIKTEKVTFRGSQGHLLSARLDSPSEDVKGYALFVHCFTCSKNVLAASRISSALVERGIAVLRFDFTGLGNSEGDFANTNFSSNIEDIKAAIEFLRAQNTPPDILIGHSLGGAAILRAAETTPELKALITINAPSTASHLLDFLKSSVAEIESQGYANVLLGGREFQIKKQLIDDLENNKSLSYLKNIHVPILIFHSPNDNTVDIENANHLFEAAHYPKNFISLTEADHLLTRPADAIYVADIITNWVNRYMLQEKPLISDEKNYNSNEVTVTETGEGKFTQKIQIGKHTLTADEPEDIGGNNKGPGPYDFLLAGLGACTSMTLRMYAERKNIPLTGIRVVLTHEKIYNNDLINCVDKNERLDLINRILYLRGDLNTEQKDDLLRIAEKCPVHKTLTQPSIIKTTLETWRP